MAERLRAGDRALVRHDNRVLAGVVRQDMPQAHAYVVDLGSEGGLLVVHETKVERRDA